MIGSDPEFAVYSDKMKHIIPVTGLLGGTKEHPVRVDRGAYQEDNVAAEICIDPVLNGKQLYKVLQHVRKQVDKLLRKHSCITIATPTAKFKKEVLISHGSALLRFGCVPEYNAHKRAFVHPPNPKQEMRTYGGHIHYSFDCGDSLEHRILFVKWMDVMLSLIAEKEGEAGAARRQMYGLMGACRMKYKRKGEYNGVEYRALGPWWTGDREACEYVARACKVAATLAGWGAKVPEDMIADAAVVYETGKGGTNAVMFGNDVVRTNGRCLR